LYEDAIKGWLAMQNDSSAIPLLTEHEWDAIRLFAAWLAKFRAATTKMSPSKQMTLSAVHAVFQDLQNKLKMHLSTLSPFTPPELVAGLTAAHRKLSDYYYKFDQLPYYIWACCVYFSFKMFISRL
jgi:hypothetical protein